jgi:hypothetical protein
VAIVGWLTAMHVDPFQAKLVAVVLLSPLGFLGHKYITYRGGGRAVIAAAESA